MPTQERVIPFFTKCNRWIFKRRGNLRAIRSWIGHKTRIAFFFYVYRTSQELPRDASSPSCVDIKKRREKRTQNRSHYSARLSTVTQRVSPGLFWRLEFCRRSFLSSVVLRLESIVREIDELSEKEVLTNTNLGELWNMQDVVLQSRRLWDFPGNFSPDGPRGRVIINKYAGFPQRAGGDHCSWTVLPFTFALLSHFLLIYFNLLTRLLELWGGGLFCTKSNESRSDRCDEPHCRFW